MNKYFLPVYNSQLKPWIKWWILKRLNGGESTLKVVTLSEGTLTKVDKSKALRIKEYYGNTVQNGTPTPDSPVEIQTISGDNTFNINSVNYRVDFGGKNLFNYANTTITNSGVTTTYNNGEISYSGTATTTYANLTDVTSLSLAPGTYTFSREGTNNVKITLRVWSVSNVRTDYNINANSNSVTFTTTETSDRTYLFISGLTANTQYSGSIKVQLEKDTVATAYSPYVSNPIELCKIGDYKDKIVNDNGTWKIEKKVGKTILNGGEYWWFNINSGVSGVGFAATAISTKNSEDYGEGLCNYFQNNKSGKAMNSVRFGANDKALYFYIDNTVFTTIDIWKTWLSTHNITVYYQLATPTTETITNTNLISQLNALYEFYVESRTVSISNNSEIPFEVLLEYYGR